MTEPSRDAGTSGGGEGLVLALREEVEGWVGLGGGGRLVWHSAFG